MSTEDWYNKLADIFISTCKEEGCLGCPAYAKMAREEWKDDNRRGEVLLYAAEKLVWLHK